MYEVWEDTGKATRKVAEYHGEKFAHVDAQNRSHVFLDFTYEVIPDDFGLDSPLAIYRSGQQVA